MISLAFAKADCPVLPRGVRMQEDRVRGGMVLLAPEKAVALDPIGTAILSRVDGSSCFGDIISDLAKTYNAPEDQIEKDVQAFLVGLRTRMFVSVVS